MIKKLIFKALILISVFGFFSCDDDFTTIGANVVGVNNFETNVYRDASLKAYNKKLDPVQTNGRSLYHLGVFNDPVYGKTVSSIAAQASLSIQDPVFGSLSQSDEDEDLTDTEENETVTKVWLNIPFFNSASLQDDGSVETVADSIYGNTDFLIDLKVQELTRFLRDFDVDSGAQVYYSNEDFTGFTGVDLFNESYAIDTAPVEILETDEDGVIVTDTDGNPVVEETLTPRIRVALDTDFFQNRIINNEGSILLSNNNVFQAEELFRGAYISINNDADVLMLLDFSEVTIDIEYEYDELNDQGTDDAADDVVETQESTYTLSLALNNVVNVHQTDPFLIDVEATEDNLYLKGTDGSMSIIELFGEDADGNGIADELEDIREEEWLINEANLVFYINQDELTDTSIEPERIYLYDFNNNTPLIDYFFDQSVNATSSALNKAIHGGIIEKDEDDKGTQYKIRITEHVNNLIRNDSTNVKLGLAVSSDINLVTNARILNGITDDEEFIPTISAMSPLGTVLYGNTPAVPEEKRLKLEIFYTLPTND